MKANPIADHISRYFQRPLARLILSRMGHNAPHPMRRRLQGRDRELLREYVAEGFTLQVACNVFPCVHVKVLDLRPIAARLGPKATVGDLRKRLRCVGCGGREFQLSALPPGFMRL
jgi:hypothetical protein